MLCCVVIVVIVSGVVFIITTNNVVLLLLFQVPVIPFCVDNLPMSDATLGIWSSLVRLAGTGNSQAAGELSGGTEEYVLPKPPVSGETDIVRVPPVRPLKPLDSTAGETLHLFIFFSLSLVPYAPSGAWGRIFIHIVSIIDPFYGVGLLAPRSTPNLKDQGFLLGCSFPLSTHSGYLELPDTHLSPLSLGCRSIPRGYDDGDV